MHKRIGILRGGVGEHYHSSLKKGGEIISHLAEFLSHKYKPHDVFIDKEGAWHLGGIPIKPSDLQHRVDLVWNVAHANHSHTLDSLSVPHISPRPFFSALKSSKKLLKEHLLKSGASLPRSIVLPLYQPDFDGPREKYAAAKAREIHAKFGAPWIVKSLTPDANMGIHLAKTFPELMEAIDDGVRHGRSILVEEFIAGKPAAIHTLAGFRNEEVYAFPFVGPSQFSGAERERLYALAKDLHHHLDAGHYMKLDILLTPRGKAYVLEFENVPDLQPGSLLSEACQSIALKPEHLVEHMLERAMNL